MQVYSTVGKDAQMNRTAQIVFSKYLHSICLQIHADYVAFLFEKKDFCEKNVKNTLLFV